MPTPVVQSQHATVGVPPAVRVLVAVALVTTVGVFPVFLVGGLGVQLRQDLDFGAAALGFATAGFFGVAALSSRVMGWLVERIGARTGMRLSALVSSACLLGLAFADNVAWLMGILWFSGIPNALAQPSSNLLVTQGVAIRWRATGFAVKQSAIPAATMLAGFAVPVVALTVGWRWAFGIAAIVGVLGALLVPQLTTDGQRQERTTGRGSSASPRTALLLIAAAGGLGSAVGNAVGAFVTSSAVQVGFSPWAAGLVLSLGSAAGLTVRLVMGVVADRSQVRVFRLIAIMLFGGSVGFVLMVVPAPIPFLIGVAIAFGVGWSWPGLLNFGVAKIAPDRVASATSFTQTGIYIGACTGPLLFGLLAESSGLSNAWIAVAIASALAGTILLFVRR